MGIEIGWHFKMSTSNLVWWDNSVNGMIQCLSLSIYQALLLQGQLIFFEQNVLLLLKYAVLNVTFSQRVHFILVANKKI